MENQNKTSTNDKEFYYEYCCKHCIRNIENLLNCRTDSDGKQRFEKNAFKVLKRNKQQSTVVYSRGHISAYFTHFLMHFEIQISQTNIEFNKLIKKIYFFEPM